MCNTCPSISPTSKDFLKKSHPPKKIQSNALVSFFYPLYLILSSKILGFTNCSHKNFRLRFFSPLGYILPSTFSSDDVTSLLYSYSFTSIYQILITFSSPFLLFYFPLSLTSFSTPNRFKTLKTKSLLAVARRKNRQLPNWFRFKTDTKIRYNAKRRNWRRTKLGI